MKRVVKHFITLILVFSMICCSSLLVFAYHPVVSVKSSDWVIDTEKTYKAVYPERIDPNYAANPKFYTHSKLNGETYFGTRNESEAFVSYKVDVNIPSPIDLGNFGSCIVVRAGDTFFYFTGCYYCSFLMYDGNLYQYCTSKTHGCITSYCDYPYSSWYSEEAMTYQVTKSLGTSLNQLVNVFETGWYYLDANTDIEIIYSSSDVELYSFYSENVGFTGFGNYEADEYSIDNGIKQSVYLQKPLFLNYGSVSVELDSSDVEKICFGSYAWLFKNFGFIFGMDSEYLTFAYSLAIKSGESNVAKTQLFSYKYNTFINDKLLDIGEAYLFNHFDVSDFEFDLTNTPLTFVFSYVFVSDGFHLYFPGSLEIIEFESYEDDMEHNEVLGAINSAAGDIISNDNLNTNKVTGAINSAAGSINSQISSSAAALSGEIQQCLNNNFDSLVTPGVSVPDTGVDTSDLDDVMSKQDALLDDIYKGLDTKQKQYLNDMGYSSVDKFFEDKINSLNNASMQSSFDYVKGLFENVLSVTGISALLYFSLIFGFGMFLIGRRVS